MNQLDFDNNINKWLEEIREGLMTKGNTYANLGDRLFNFVEGGRFNNETPEEYLWGLVSKHIVALKSFVQGLEKDRVISQEQWLEKTADIIAYILLLRALLVDRGIL